MEKQWRGKWIEREGVPPWKERQISNVPNSRREGDTDVWGLEECWWAEAVRVYGSADQRHSMRPVFSPLEAWCGTTADTNPSLVSTKGRSYPRFPLSHFWVNTQVLFFYGAAVVLGPTVCWLKNLADLLCCVLGLGGIWWPLKPEGIWWPLKPAGSTLPFQLIMSFALGLSLLFSGGWYLPCCFILLCFVQEKKPLHINAPTHKFYVHAEFYCAEVADGSLIPFVADILSAGPMFN